MTIASADELALEAMSTTWERLHSVSAMTEAMLSYLIPRLGGSGFDAAGLSLAYRLIIEFNGTWHHYRPTCWELVVADRQGRLQNKINELNALYAQEVAHEDRH